jgi:3-oxoadipate enol-lactonase
MFDMSHTTLQHHIPGPVGNLSVLEQGNPNGPAIVMSHSILSSGMMWAQQAELLAACGWRVLRADIRGHGGSEAGPAPYVMDDLVADTIAILDALHIERAHYVGLSLGAMSGFGLGIRHPERVLSLLLCDGRADMPEAAGAMWNERIDAARAQGCGVLAVPTTERWFGKAFLDAHPDTAKRFQDTVGATQVEGFVGCAQAIQTLNYLPQAASIQAPTTLLTGANDGVFPQVMGALCQVIPNAKLEIIADAGHLPNIDQPTAFNAALMRHFFNTPAWSQP